MHTGIVFRPKIGDHLRKGENVSVNSYTAEEIQELDTIYYNGIAINIPKNREVVLDRLYGSTVISKPPNNPTSKSAKLPK